MRQSRPRVYLKEGTYHTRLFGGTSTNGIEKWDSPDRSWPTPLTMARPEVSGGTQITCPMYDFPWHIQICAIPHVPLR
jgi:hypothetical protein